MSRANTRAALVAAAILAISAPHAGWAQDQKPAETTAPAPDSVVAKVGGVEINERELALAMADLSQQFAQVPEERRRAAVLNALIEIKLLARQAEAAKIPEDQAFQARMSFLRDRALHNQLFQQNVVEKITDEEVKARYDKEVAAMDPEQEVKARHILVKSREEAEEIIKELQAGKDFQEIAKAKTIDPSGSTSGGDLGWFGKGQMVPAFEQAAFALAKGDYSKEPVESQFGFHVILKEDERVSPPPPFENVEGQVRQIVMREKYQELIDAARKAGNVEIVDPELKSQLDEVQAAQ